MAADDIADRIPACSKIIYDGFQRYNKNFHRVTERACIRFEHRDWKGHQQDIADRLELYEKSVSRIAASVQTYLGKDAKDHHIWNEIRLYYGARLENIPDAAFIKTFFNSVTRRVFGTIGFDKELEFAFSSMDSDVDPISSLNLYRYPYWGSLEETARQILEDFSFNVDYKSLEEDCAFIASKIKIYCEQKHPDAGEYIRFELIDTVFYQSARAYLVGRIIKKGDKVPLVIAFENTDDGIATDAVLLSAEEVSIVFGYTRSYYFADPSSVEGAVHFLRSVLPDKPIDELFTVLGRMRQGKTERFRAFAKHLENTSDKFVHADGAKGLVMMVFTLPSYNLVFKIIRDRFGYPKTISRKDVIEKYRLVSRHDRAGRLIDTQEFLDIEFPLDRFSDDLLTDLLEHAKDTVSVVDDQLLIKHVYVERCVRPLNLYIMEQSKTKAELAILDYGQALKDLAQTNIFPGDLLLKNFGVTQHGRIVFYDYDEVALITECNFRDIPQTDDPDNELRASTWFHVAENDIFPEEHLKFLSMNQDLRDLFMRVHSDLNTAEYWREIKNRHLAGETSTVIPYIRPVIPPFPGKLN